MGFFPFERQRPAVYALLSLLIIVALSFLVVRTGSVALTMTYF